MEASRKNSLCPKEGQEGFGIMLWNSRRIRERQFDLDKQNFCFWEWVGKKWRSLVRIGRGSWKGPKRILLLLLLLTLLLLTLLLICTAIAVSYSHEAPTYFANLKIPKSD
jgi:hypothetical protein